MDRMLWTEDEKATVVKQWERGLSAELIAVELSRNSGRPFTRNMVIGKVNRLRSDGLIGDRDGTILRKQYSRRKQYLRGVDKQKLVYRSVELPKINALHIRMEALTKNLHMAVWAAEGRGLQLLWPSD